MAETSTNPLLSTLRASDTSPTVQLHPLVLLTISDCITRHTLRQQTGPVVGAILGQQNGQDVTMEVAFQAKLNTDDRGEVELDADWFSSRLEDCELVMEFSQPLEGNTNHRFSQTRLYTNNRHWILSAGSRSARPLAQSRTSSLFMRGYHSSSSNRRSCVSSTPQMPTRRRQLRENSPSHSTNPSTRARPVAPVTRQWTSMVRCGTRH